MNDIIIHKKCVSNQVRGYFRYVLKYLNPRNCVQKIFINMTQSNSNIVQDSCSYPQVD